MTRKELALQLAASRGTSRHGARVFVDAFFHVVAKTLADGEAVRLRGFGTFEVRLRAARVIRRRGGKAATVDPASLIPAFRWAPGLVRRVMNGEPQVRPGQ